MKSDLSTPGYKEPLIVPYKSPDLATSFDIAINFAKLSLIDHLFLLELLDLSKENENKFKAVSLLSFFHPCLTSGSNLKLAIVLLHSHCTV